MTKWLPKGFKCESDLHKHPIRVMTWAELSAEHARRLYQGWKNPECPTCGLFGWIPPDA